MTSQTTPGNRRTKQTTAEPWHFRDLLVWQKTLALAGDVHQITSAFPTSEVFGLTSQLRRAAVSVPSNIAEGCGRVSAGEKRQFFGHSRGSTYEIETQLCIAESLSYLDRARLQKLLEQCWEIVRMLNALIQRLDRDHV
jgi:four helix bundle protein